MHSCGPEIYWSNRGYTLRKRGPGIMEVEIPGVPG